MREADVLSTEEVAAEQSVRDPPGVVMVSLPTTQRNASRAQCEGRAKGGQRGQQHGHYKGRSPVEPRLDKRRAMGRIEHTLLVRGWSTPQPT